MICVENLTVRFGGVTPIDGVSVTFTDGICGLLGPNGAGKTTFFNVLSGFIKPSTGTVHAFGDDLLAMSDFRRARWGLRRSFQQEQSIEHLTAFDNVLLVTEMSGDPRRKRRALVHDALRFVGLDRLADETVGHLSAQERRLVEIARTIVGTSRVVLLDEPAAGLPDEESRLLAELIIRIPEERNALVVLVDHDIDLVRQCCATATVLDFGKLLAHGETSEVLSDERVVQAYLGTGDV